MSFSCKLICRTWFTRKTVNVVKELLLKHFVGERFQPYIYGPSIHGFEYISQMSGTYYAVGRGREPGVYTSWVECEKQVKNIANAKYRKFKTHEEAQNFVRLCAQTYSPYKLSQNSEVLSQDSSQRVSSQEIVSSDEESNLTNTATGSCKRNIISSFSVKASLAESSEMFETNSNPMPKKSQAQKIIPSQDTSLNKDVLDSIQEMKEEMLSFISEVRTNFDIMNKKLEAIISLSGSKINTNERKTLRIKHEKPTTPQRDIKRFFSTNRPSTSETDCLLLEPPRKVPKIEILDDDDDDDDDNLDNTFNLDEQGYVMVYTDGACENNGKKGARAGIGVWFGDGHPLNCSEAVQGRPTNNVAEIEAAVQAVELAKRAGVKKLVINTDSEFMINCITKWMPKWKKNNWKVASGGDVKNKQDLMLLEEAMKGISVKWNHVRGHVGIHGNEMADRLARDGARLYIPGSNLR